MNQFSATDGVNSIFSVEVNADTTAIRCVVQIRERYLSCKIIKIYSSKDCSLYLSGMIEDSYNYNNISDMVDISFLQNRDSEQFRFVAIAENTSHGIVAILEGRFTTKPHSSICKRVLFFQY